MSTYQIPWKILNYHHKGRRDRGQPLLRDGWINSPNREIINLVDDDDDDDDEQSWTEHTETVYSLGYLILAILKCYVMEISKNVGETKLQNRGSLMILT
jgi:hypothetical protein